MKNIFRMIAFVAMILCSTQIGAQKPFTIDGTVSNGLADVKYYLYDQERMYADPSDNNPWWISYDDCYEWLF